MNYSEQIIREKIKNLRISSIREVAIIEAQSKEIDEFYPKLNMFMIDGFVNEKEFEVVVPASKLSYISSAIPEENLKAITTDLILVTISLNKQDDDLLNLKIALKIYNEFERNKIKLVRKQDDLFDELNLYINKKDWATAQKILYSG